MCVWESDKREESFVVLAMLHPCSCVFVFLWGCGRALYPYIFLTSGWSLMGHAPHTAPSGCVCVCVCIYSSCIQIEFSSSSAYSVWISITSTCPSAVLFNTPGLLFSPRLYVFCVCPLVLLLHICNQRTQSNHHKPLSHHLSIASSLPLPAPSLHTLSGTVGTTHP